MRGSGCVFPERSGHGREASTMVGGMRNRRNGQRKTSRVGGRRSSANGQGAIGPDGRGGNIGGCAVRSMWTNNCVGVRSRGDRRSVEGVREHSCW